MREEQVEILQPSIRLICWIVVFVLKRLTSLSTSWNNMGMKERKKKALDDEEGRFSTSKGPDTAINYVGTTKVLPLIDAALSSRHQYGNDERRDQKAKSDKTKTLSKMKELIRWAAAAKSEKAGNYIN